MTIQDILYVSGKLLSASPVTGLATPGSEVERTARGKRSLNTAERFAEACLSGLPGFYMW